jgi:hypothetical protein
MTGSTPPIDSSTTWASPDIQEKTRTLESLLHQNPALSFVLGVTDLMHKMRELFVDIAILEGEERGIFVGEQTTPESQNPGESLLFDEAPRGEQALSGVLGLQFQVEEQRIPSVPAEDDPPMFDLDDINDNDGLIVPGQFTPAVQQSSLESSRRPKETVLENLNPSVNPYAALALSSVLATLFVVAVVVGRHYYLTTRVNSEERDVEDQLERGEATAADQLDGSGEKPASTQPSVGSGGESAAELDEKAVVELESHLVSPEPESLVKPEGLVKSAGSSDTSATELDEKVALELQSNASPAEDRQSSEELEAKEAMSLLIDVANAAFTSTPSAAVGANIARTPKAVSSALETIRSEVTRTPQTRHLQIQSPGSRPGTPLASPVCPGSVLGGPTVVVGIGKGVSIGGDVVVESERLSPSQPGSPHSDASSFVSAYSHMPGGALSIGRAAGRSKGRTVLASVFVTQRTLSVPQPSRAASPAPSLLSAGGASPTLSTISYATAIEAPASPVRKHEPDSPPLNTDFHTLPTRATSPGYFPQPPGALQLFGEYGQVYGEDATDEHEMISMATGASGSVQMRPAVLPPAQLTQTALELALMLPATEWIFQFIVVFIGWFGFWMRPVGTVARAPREPSRG